MTKYYYKKKNHVPFKWIVRLCAFILVSTGIVVMVFAFLPLVSWSVYFAPAFAAQKVAIPIPKITLVNAYRITTTDYTDARNWFPTVKRHENSFNIKTYSLSIPKLGIKQAEVTTEDNDLSKHLVQFEGTTMPPQNGNTVIFGHSTLPQLFSPTDYKTIFANAYKLQLGDDLFLNVSGVLYSYKVVSITVVDPDDTSIFFQDMDASYVTLVTCTPPGTTWKRLIVKAAIEKI